MIVSLFEEKYLEGEAKEKINSRIEMIFLFLADQFDGVPKELEKKVQKITNVEKLNELAKFSTKCGSLDEFEKALDS